jgi:carbonic anhydrase/acetyltransferase-like protein (isoleucine patch superfamily)
MILDYLGRRPRIHPSAYIAPGAVVVGDVEIGPDASLWFGVVVRGDVHFIRIGAATNIQDGSILHVTHDTHPLVLEDRITVGHNVTLHGCTIRRHVLVGMGAIIMDGAEVGSESLVGAGCLVPEGMKVPPRTLVVGVPARVVRPLTDTEVEGLHESADNYIRYARTYRQAGPSPEA